MTKNTGKAKVIDVFSALVFMGKSAFRESQSPENTRKTWSKEDLSLVEEVQIRGHLN